MNQAVSSLPSVSVACLLTAGLFPFGLVLVAGEAGLNRLIANARVQKPGLALVGHFHGVVANRVQILGATELSFLAGLGSTQCANSCQGFANLRPCAIVVTTGAEVPDSLRIACDETATPLFVSSAKSSVTINALHVWLDEELAPRTRLHGVLVSIFGLGVLLRGTSGIGKSESALDLVARGHRLVADDVVECSFHPPGHIFGKAADLLQHHIEIRGLGILNVKDLFGVTAVSPRTRIELVIQLSAESETSLEYDRLGVDDRYAQILGTSLPELTIPVRPGRDMATILEIAARNELLKQAGHHGARAFRARLESALVGPTTPSSSTSSGDSKVAMEGPHSPAANSPVSRPIDGGSVSSHTEDKTE